MTDHFPRVFFLFGAVNQFDPSSGDVKARAGALFRFIEHRKTLGPDNQLVTHLGDNPDPALRANREVPREQWRDGEFIAPHSAAWDSSAACPAAVRW